MALLSWDLEVKGADKAEAAIEAVDRSARDAAEGMKKADKASDDLGSGLDGAAAAAREADQAFDGAAAAAREAARASDSAGDGVGGLNDRVRDGLAGFDEFGGRLGQVSNALNVLSGVALVGMVTGLKDAVTALYEMTEAGQAAKVAAEAQATAISGVVDWLKEQKKITEQTTAATWAKINADRAQAVSADRLTKVIEAQYTAQEKFGELVVEIGRRRAAGEREFDFGVSGRTRTELGRLVQQYELLREELVELEGERETEQSRLIAINTAVNDATAALDKSGTTFDEHTASVQSHADALREDAEAAEALANRINLSSRFFSRRAEAEAEAAEEAQKAREAEKAREDDRVAGLRRLSAAYADHAERVKQAAAQAEQAQYAEAAAYAASAQSVIGTVGAVSDALGAGAAVKSAIGIAENVAGAAEQGALAIAAGASGNIPSAIAHGAAAVEHTAAAIKWGVDALGGGGGTKAPPSTGTPTPPTSSPRDTVEAGDRSRNQQETGSLTVQFMNAQPLATKAEIQDAILQAQNEAGRRRDRARVDYSRTSRRGRG